jgi:hypothetical protein
VAAKFVENEFEKADRLMELFFDYHRALREGLDRIKQREDLETDEIDSELRESGQFMVQQVLLLCFASCFGCYCELTWLCVDHWL